MAAGPPELTAGCFVVEMNDAGASAVDEPVEAWRPPSDRVAELVRAAATAALNASPLLTAVNDETVGALPPAIHDDPVLARSMRATNRVNVTHWLSHLVMDPYARVPPARSKEAISLGRDLARRGHDASALGTYLSGQNVAWKYWMKRCFTATSDVGELQDLLDYSARSMFDFVQATMVEISRVMRSERDTITEGASAERLELVGLILQGTTVSIDLAITRLNHDIRAEQTAAVFWHEPGETDPGLLHRAAVAASVSAEVARPLVVSATSSSVWAWYASGAAPDLVALADSVKSFPGVRVAIGATESGVDGFRRSHNDAVATQRLMFRAPATLRSATYDEVRVVTLVTSEPAQAYDFVERTLGELAHAEYALQDTLRVYLREDSSAARAARALYAHRNTILNRVARAEALLPAPLEGRGLPVGLALEILRWLGPRATPDG